MKMMKMNMTSVSLFRFQGLLSSSSSSSSSSLLVALCFVALVALVAKPVSSATRLPALQVDGSKICVAGVSSGANMAIQYQVAFSSKVNFVAAFSGAPYYCARDSQSRSLNDCRSEADRIDLHDIWSYLSEQDNQGKVDHTSNLSKAKLWLFRGTKDSIRGLDVIEKTKEFYEHFTSDSQIKLIDTIPAQHAWITGGPFAYGKSCGHFGSPYLNNCGYDASGEFLRFFFGELHSPVEAPSSNLFSFQQRDFTGEADLSDLSLGESGYVYASTGCLNGRTKCKLIVAFHGCQQGFDEIGTEFVRHSGLNEWAEANNFIVLYPQIQATDMNPTGCWDWYGYTGSNYATKSAPQMQTVNSMIQRLVSSNLSSTSTTGAGTTGSSRRRLRHFEKLFARK